MGFSTVPDKVNPAWQHLWSCPWNSGATWHCESGSSIALVPVLWPKKFRMTISRCDSCYWKPTGIQHEMLQHWSLISLDATTNAHKNQSSLFLLWYRSASLFTLHHALHNPTCHEITKKVNSNECECYKSCLSIKNPSCYSRVDKKTHVIIFSEDS